jgi:hypothetical protein
MPLEMEKMMERIEVNRTKRGHRFFPDNCADVPALYSTEDVPLKDKIIHLHYFIGGSDWYVSEFDKATGLAFGFAVLNFQSQDSEWGYSNLYDLERLELSQGDERIVNRDLRWEPKKFSEITLPWESENQGFGSLSLEPADPPVQVTIYIVPDTES